MNKKDFFENCKRTCDYISWEIQKIIQEGGLPCYCVVKTTFIGDTAEQIIWEVYETMQDAIYGLKDLYSTKGEEDAISERLY